MINKPISNEQIYEFINSQSESDFWDFKFCWYKNNVDLVGDIISFANTVHHNDCYIIIGVSDDFEVVGVDQSDPNIRNTQNINNILRDAHFNTDRIPNVRVTSNDLNRKRVDVITIFDSSEVPFFLDENYSKYNNGIKDQKCGKLKTLSKHSIYSRKEDSNTSKNVQADFNQIKNLWKKRFGLDLLPEKQFEIALQHPDQWKLSSSSDKEDYYYYKKNPQFKIKISDDPAPSMKLASFSIKQNDPSVWWLKVVLSIDETNLETMQAAYLDGGRYFNVIPIKESINPIIDGTNKLFGFYYLKENSLRWNVYNFFNSIQLDNEEGNTAEKIFSDSFILVDSSEELYYLKNNLMEKFYSNPELFLVSEKDKKAISPRIKDLKENDINYNSEWWDGVISKNKIASYVNSNEQDFLFNNK